MVENTKIEWATHTLNWWTGCEAVSPACAHCYAETWAKRAGRDFAERRLTSNNIHRLPLKWEREAIETGERPYVFVNSLSDFFDNKVPQAWRDSFFAIAKQTRHVTYMLLTKRVGNVKKMLPDDWAGGAAYPNVWIGSTVVNQEEANRDWPKLARTPAARHFLSMEPLLGPVDLYDACDAARMPGLDGDLLVPDWIICGGESGSGARPMSPLWVRKIQQFCEEFDVPFFFKQWGEWRAFHMSASTDAQCEKLLHARHAPEHAYVEDIFCLRVGKENAGRDICGEVFSDRPAHHQLQ